MMFICYFILEKENISIMEKWKALIGDNLFEWKKNKMMNEISAEKMNKHKHMNFCSIRSSSILEEEFLLYNFFRSLGN